jgi:colanic acid/amylovoran biosynthesis glycosyltransferase
MNTVVSEALATGLPVITTRHSGLPEQVREGLNGFLVAEGDYEALAERLAFFIEHPERWPAMSDAARRHVLAHYDAGKLIERQIALYAEVIQAG